ncbi:MAG TPA: 1-(5-phosphoribosyl)-5-[(5-phosphoribosylamino)methylideneamino]imidazole-4-carboxamide isomerase [Syntrophales bacterium]|nr:1-(5-phosphoribosyl)-5-[(5-phosphoribosylamino)methylideneamino]imidazole-4-carboxamide isomerase [Syntrophales bacterium]HOL58356.1 1-(5-phosphoribosyl)-5-[(5-phosphoribosylamino)methylideneamino]imidazole-4-carboxamide isomerase [Syntrophales bacterium]HPO34525.1 1-(5-phosphoribosyl)-5-[(5-phosphoribosylamino)methylideneamino]imidazole-4-carboxamide isomerase [Syntrophales bacterium]
MIVIPAIDLKDGLCVRLAQGDFKRITVYDADPSSVAKKWQDEGAERIHLVDLDGSLEGKPKNLTAIARIMEETRVPIQVGGGIRDLKTIETYLGLGVRWVILGTSAIREESFLTAACQLFPGHIMLGLDAVNGKVAIQGWTELIPLNAIEIARRYDSLGIEAIIYTDVSRDGMKTGVNVEETRKLAEAVHVPVIASGGVKNLTDIARLMEVEHTGILGVIVGRALYTGDLSLSQAIAFTKKAVQGGA